VKVSIVGQGYVGLPLAIAAATAGHKVIGIDLDESLVGKIRKGVSPSPDLTDAQLTHVLQSGAYEIASNFESVATSDVVLICVPTPLGEGNNPDYSYLISALQLVAQNLRLSSLVIVESTVSPGDTRGRIKNLLDKSGVSYGLAYSPERIDPANTKWSVTNTPKLLAGLTKPAEDRAKTFYDSFLETVKIGSSVEVVEAAKLLENSFRLINISFINEFAQFCAALKIDVREVIDAAASKPYGFMPFHPSVGIGGHCIPVDPQYLVAKARELGVPTRFIDLANDINHSLASYFTGVASGILGELVGKRILVVGIAYKSQVSDVRETPAARLIYELRSRGAVVTWHDELVQEWNGENSVPLSADYDLVILANPHKNTELSLLKSAKVLNTQGGY